jgi:hypothetical protein
VYPDLKPKPAYMAIQTLTRELSGYRLSRRLSLTNSQDYVLLCTNASGMRKLGAWTVAGAHTASLAAAPQPGERLKGVHGNGESFEPRLSSGKLVLELTPRPQYVSLGLAEVGGP